MMYNLIGINKPNCAILINVKGTKLWIDYRKILDWYEWDFNQYIFSRNSKHDQKIKQIQDEIYNDIENFSYFMDSIFCELESEAE